MNFLFFLLVLVIVYKLLSNREGFDGNCFKKLYPFVDSSLNFNKYGEKWEDYVKYNLNIDFFNNSKQQDKDRISYFTNTENSDYYRSVFADDYDSHSFLDNMNCKLEYLY